MLKLLSETRIKPEGENNPRQTYRYLYMGTQRIARVETDSKTQKDRVLYYHNDPMGTPIMMTIQDTASTQNYYGVSHQAMDPWGYELRAGYFTGTNDVIYTQKILDQNTGLYDFGYRFYDRDAAQFLVRDLVPPQYETPLTLNTFQFCLNNPNVYVDPDGRLPVDQLVANAKVISLTGLRTHPITHKQEGHKGVDVVGDRNIHAAADGVINRTPYFQLGSDGKGWGNFLEILHELPSGEKYITRYAHLKNLPSFKKGDKISEGDVIAEMGSTGGSTGVHLHFEIFKYDLESKKWEAMNQGGKFGFPNIGNFQKLFEALK